MRNRLTKYSIGYGSLTEPFEPKQFTAILYGHYAESRDPVVLVTSKPYTSKEHAVLSLADALLRAGYQPKDLPAELSAAVLVAAEEAVERAQDHLAQQVQIRDEALTALRIAKGSA